MSAIIEAISLSWKKNEDYGQRLVADLSDEQMILQPAPDGQAPANHPAWVLAHLNTYIPIVGALIQGEEFPDPKDAPFGMQSKPESELGIYPAKADLVQTFVTGHQQVAEFMENANPRVLERPVSLVRWQERMPSVAAALIYLGMCHENLHLGQLSAWRRIQGMPSV